ncbi:MAG: HlyD family efflux transporter periplasmic adaptor subunit [Phycisphaerales bacterium]|nr:HlyD family efflux transporter periplasmic adaptor subunit [Phycisphaerales bacterium]
MNLGLPILLVVAAVAIGAVLISSPPNVPKSQPESLAPVVGVAELVKEDFPVFVNAYGTVVPSRELRIIPEVAGRIVELNQSLEPGGILKQGELLFRIDPTDYEIAVAQAEADLDVANHETAQIRARIDSLESRGEQIDVEIGYLKWNADRVGGLAEQNSAGESEARDASTKLASQRAARQTLNAEIAEQHRAVESAAANVRVLERRLEVAKLALARTEVIVPFDALVVSEGVEVGQRVGPQAAIATLVSTDEFWTEAAIPVARLRDLRFANDYPDNPSRVTVSMSTSTMSSGDNTVEWTGLALRPLGNLDPLGRMATVLVAIKDPLGLSNSAADNPQNSVQRVLLGSYVRLRIDSGTLNDVYSIPRKALRENDRVWVRDAEGLLAIRPVKIVWRRQDDVLVRNGFKPDDMLVTTHLASVVPGMPLRVREDSANADPNLETSPSTPQTADATVASESKGATP